VYHRGIRVKYLEGEEVKAPDGRKLLAFDDEDTAVDFLVLYESQVENPHYYSEYLLRRKGKFTGEVWEAEATDVEELAWVSYCWESLRALKEFWECLPSVVPMNRFTAPYSGWAHAPEGAVSCKTIKLVKKVYPNGGADVLS
jgi:hypothetical protein